MNTAAQCAQSHCQDSVGYRDLECEFSFAARNVSMRLSPISIRFDRDRLLNVCGLIRLESILLLQKDPYLILIMHGCTGPDIYDGKRQIMRSGGTFGRGCDRPV